MVLTYISRRFAAAMLVLALMAGALIAPPASAAIVRKLTVTNAAVTEKTTKTTFNFVVKLSRKHTKTVTVFYATKSGTAAGGKDFSSKSGKLMFKPGQAAKKVVVTVLPDALDENNETMKLVLKKPANAKIADGTGVGTIKDDSDGPPVVSLTGRDPILGLLVVDENAGAASIKVQLSKPSGKTVAVDYETIEASATSGSDYTHVDSKLAFAPGKTLMTISIPVVNDAVAEGVEHFNISLSAPVNATLASSGDQVNIKDPCADDLHEQDDTRGSANPLTDGPSIQAVACPLDPDQFSFALTKGQVATVSLEWPDGEPAGLSSGLYLNDSSGGQVGIGNASRSLAMVAAPTTGTYFAVVYSDGVGAPYEISLVVTTPAPCAADANEEDDIPSQAKALPTNGTPVEDLQICSGDPDYFSFTAGKHDSMTIEVAHESSPDSDLDFEVLSADGTEGFVSSETVDNPEVLTDWHVPAAGTYLVRVYGFPEGAQLGYSIEATRTPLAACSNEASEPNNTHATAEPMALASDVNAAICAEDVDVWSLNLTENHVVTVNLTGADLEATVTTAAGAEVPVTYFDGGLEFTTTATGNYHVTVKAGWSYIQRNYLLRAEATSLPVCENDDHEPNDAHTDATEIADGETKNGTFCPGDYDFFVFTATEGDALTIEYTPSSLGGTTGADLSVADETVMGYAGPHGGGTLEVPYVPYTGTHYLYVYSNRPGAMNDYSIELTVTPPVPPCDNDASEPNDDAGSAVPLGGPTAATICPGDQDHFSFEANAGDPVTVTLTPDGSDPVAEMTISGPGGAGPWGPTSSGNRAVSFEAPVSGMYVVRIASDDLSVTNTYTLDVDVTPPSPCEEHDPSEPNDTVGAAQEIGEGVVEGVICPANDDYYFFTTSSGGRASTITIRFEHGGEADVDLQLLDGTGAVVASATGEAAEISYPIDSSEPNTWYIRVFVAGGGTTRYAFEYDRVA
jgi:hypothetical protein